jgi:hypothetical protein
MLRMSPGRLCGGIVTCRERQERGKRTVGKEFSYRDLLSIRCTHNQGRAWSVTIRDCDLENLGRGRDRDRCHDNGCRGSNSCGNIFPTRLFVKW